MTDDTKQIDDGGPAFPVIERFSVGERSVDKVAENGMSLRDYFAAMSLAHPYSGLSDDPSMTAPDQTADWAYNIADAMIERRKVVSPKESK